MDWDHGYYANSAYTCGFYRETAPNWLDFAALVKGHPSPRRREGAPFHYLDLGCGTGFGLCLLAALYPEGQFVGVDFQPDHIAHASWLSEQLGLTNIHFLEADFLALQQDPTPLDQALLRRGADADPGDRPGIDREVGYHYVIAHGIASWVALPVQEALLAVAARALRPNGIFYCSYNTYPGWLPLEPFKHLVQLEASRGDAADPAAAFRRAIASFQAMLGTDEAPLPLAQLLPTLPREIEKITGENINYLYGEYLVQGWAPLHVAELQQRAQRHKLSAISSATLTELFEMLLPERLRAIALPEANPLLRQSLIDLGTVKGFRRDLLVRGDLRLQPLTWKKQLGHVVVRLQEAPPVSSYQFETSFGAVQGRAEAYIAFETALAAGPLSLAELGQRIDQPIEELAMMAALLIDADRLALDRGPAGAAAAQACARVNQTVIDLMQDGWPYAHLSAPAIGNGITCSPLEATLLQAMARKESVESAAAIAVATAERLGAVVSDGQRQPLTGERERRSVLKTMADQLSQKRLPYLEPLGVLTAPQRPEVK